MGLKPGQILPKRAGPKKGSKNHQKWDEKSLQKLADKIVEESLIRYSFEGIANACDLTTETIYALEDEYDIIRKAFSKARQNFVEKALSHGYAGVGMPSIVGRSLSYHARRMRAEERKEELEDFEKKELAKRAIDATQENGMTPSQALALQEYIAKYKASIPKKLAEKSEKSE